MNLKYLREIENKKVKEVADYLGITVQSYYSYENNQTVPNLSTLIKLADYYHVSLDYLVGREFASDIGYVTESEKTLIALFRQLSQENQNKLSSNATDLLIKQK